MSDMLERAARHLAKRMRDTSSVGVTYRRGTASYRVRATKGASTHQADNATGGLLQWESVDWLIDYAELPITPTRGDVIEWTNPRGQVESYEVVNPLSEDHFSNSDEHKYTMRIHTQRITQT